MEKAVLIQEWEDYPNSKYVIEHVYLFHDFVPHSKNSWDEVGADLKGFPLERRSPRAEAPLSKVGHSLCKEE